MFPGRFFWVRWVLGFLAAGLLLVVYIFQRQLFWSTSIFTDSEFQYVSFIANRVIRLVANDVLCLVLFVVIFNRKEELKLASILFVIELVIVLPVYFILKLLLEGDSEISSPLLSFIHRLIINPLLMFILLAGLLFQYYSKGKKLNT